MSIEVTSLFARATIVEKGKTKAVIGEYNKERSKQLIPLALMTMATTAIWLSLKFAQELMQNEEWHSLFSSTIPKMWKHFGKITKGN